MYLRFLAAAVILLSLPCLISCFYRQRGHKLYYIHHQGFPLNDSSDFCEHLGGELAHNFRLKDKQWLIDVRTNTTAGFWLNAGKDLGGYRWKPTGTFVVNGMWASNEPNCDGDCGFVFGNKRIGTNDYGFIALPAADKHFPLCVVDLKNDTQTDILASQLFLTNEPDRPGIEEILRGLKKNPILKAEPAPEPEPENHCSCDRIMEVERKVDFLLTIFSSNAQRITRFVNNQTDISQDTCESHHEEEKAAGDSGPTTAQAEENADHDNAGGKKDLNEPGKRGSSLSQLKAEIDNEEE